MAVNLRRSNSGQTISSSSNHHKTTSYSSSSPFASSTITSPLLHRSTSPTRVNVFKSTPPSPHSLRFDHRSGSPNPNRAGAVSRKPVGPAGPGEMRRTCSCSPTNHPGSFRCSLHKRSGGGGGGGGGKRASFGCNNKLERSAMANSLVRIGAVEGDLVKRALAALIRPSSHQLRRRENFQSRPSRLSVMARD